VRSREAAVDLEALGNFGDFVGGLAVVVTLAYLALQIRQNSRQIATNTAATRAAAYHAELSSHRNANMELVRDRSLAELAFTTSLEELDPVDRVRVETLYLDSLRARQHLFLQAREGLIREDLLGTHDAGLLALFASPIVRNLWQQRSDLFVPDFVDHVEGLRARRGSMPKMSWERSEPIAS
jgi:hypothetical protein